MNRTELSAKLAELQKLRDAATPGPWKSRHHGVYREETPICQVSCTLGKYEPEESNRDFIASIHALHDLLAAYDKALAEAELRSQPAEPASVPDFQANGITVDHSDHYTGSGFGPEVHIEFEQGGCKLKAIRHEDGAIEVHHNGMHCVTRSGFVRPASVPVAWEYRFTFIGEAWGLTYHIPDKSMFPKPVGDTLEVRPLVYAAPPASPEQGNE